MLLLNAVDRRLLDIEGALYEQHRQRLKQMAQKAQDQWNDALSTVIKEKPMRDRPPVDADIAYDEEQGALIWESLPALPAAPEPADESA